LLTPDEPAEQDADPKRNGEEEPADYEAEGAVLHYRGTVTRPDAWPGATAQLALLFAKPYRPLEIPRLDCRFLLGLKPRNLILKRLIRRRRRASAEHRDDSPSDVLGAATPSFSRTTPSTSCSVPM
jgi:hypothetical protein